jgi:hypothetical protein
MDKAILDLQDELNQLQQQLAAAQAALAASQAALAAEEQVTAQLQQQLTQAQAQVLQLQQQITVLQQQISVLQGQNQELTTTNAQLTAANAQLTSANAALTEQVNQLTVTNQTLTVNIRNAPYFHYRYFGNVNWIHTFGNILQRFADLQIVLDQSQLAAGNGPLFTAIEPQTQSMRIDFPPNWWPSQICFDIICLSYGEYLNGTNSQAKFRIEDFFYDGNLTLLFQQTDHEFTTADSAVAVIGCRTTSKLRFLYTPVNALSSVKLSCVAIDPFNGAIGTSGQNSYMSLEVTAIRCSAFAPM